MGRDTKFKGQKEVLQEVAEVTEAEGIWNHVRELRALLFKVLAELWTLDLGLVPRWDTGRDTKFNGQ
jgi:hypothetical protein